LAAAGSQLNSIIGQGAGGERRLQRAGADRIELIDNETCDPTGRYLVLDTATLDATLLANIEDVRRLFTFDFPLPIPISPCWVSATARLQQPGHTLNIGPVVPARKPRRRDQQLGAAQRRGQLGRRGGFRPIRDQRHPDRL
jgi:hypothetical protein